MNSRTVGRIRPRPARSRAARWIHVLFALALFWNSASFAADPVARTGTIVGRVFDGGNGAPIENATIILLFPDPKDGGEPPQEVTTSGPSGDYEFEAVPVGQYSLSFIKSGYRASSITDFEVLEGEDNVADFPMPVAPTSASGEILELDAFVVEAAVVGDLMNNIDVRIESDQLLNLLSSEDLSKYAASNVADVLKRVAGVTVVEGRFAIIRGLEDRYSATLFNGAPIPSPDPTSQSVQLDLFPSDIVGNLEVAKTFVASSPSNASGGSIDINTYDYPEEWTLKFSASSGFNENPLDRFLRFQTDSAIGVDVEGDETIESDFSFSMGGRFEVLDREARFKVVIANEVDYDTALGFTEKREPLSAVERRGTVTRTGDLSLGELSLSGGRFDLTESARAEQETYFGAFGFDLDPSGHHRIDGSILYTKKSTETVQLLENGYLPGFDYAGLDPEDYLNENLFENVYTKGTFLNAYREEEGAINRGPLAFLPRFQSQSLDEVRELNVYQLNGSHDIEWVDGLSFEWVANYATTNQTEKATRARFWFEPNQVPDPVDAFIPATFPPQIGDFGPGRFVGGTAGTTLRFANEIKENQYFSRADLSYEFEPIRHVAVDLTAGFWFEQANRKVDIQLNTNPQGLNGLPGVVGSGSSAYVEGASADQLGQRLFRGVGLNDPQNLLASDFKRENIATALEGKFTLWDDFDVVAGVRLENIRIVSENEPFNGNCTNRVEDVPGSAGGFCPSGFIPNIFPGRYLYIDRLDNPNNPFFAETAAPAGTAFNDQILGIDLVPDENGIVDVLSREDILRVANGEIDEFKVLPTAGVTYRPIEGAVIRAAYSQTVARPSFRELGYYPTIQFGTSEFVLGNPQLQLSDVESFDTRFEYTWGDFGDLVAFSVFYKTIQKPIEAIVLRDPVNLDSDTAFRVFRNNENDATLFGLEVEARSNLGILGEFFETISIGGNYTYIDAEVERSEFELARSVTFFGATAADIAAGRVRFDRLDKKRRLFNQPEWIGNADISFDHPKWGTKMTLSIFAISEVLDSAGSATLLPNGRADSLRLDRFVDSFYQLDFVLAQSFEIPVVPGEWTFKTSIKNLTDTTRKIIYDQQQTTDDIRELSVKLGRDYSFAIQYQIAF